MKKFYLILVISTATTASHLAAVGNTEDDPMEVDEPSKICTPVAEHWSFVTNPRNYDELGAYDKKLRDIVDNAMGGWQNNPWTMSPVGNYMVFENSRVTQRYIEEEKKDMVTDINRYLRSEKIDLRSFMDRYASTYKIHISVKPEYMAWTIGEFVKTLKEYAYTNYRFKIATVDPTGKTERTAPPIVLYVPDMPVYDYATGKFAENPDVRPENLQRLFNKLYDKFQHCSQIAGMPLKHNCGGPVVWIAGGHADLKPGSRFFQDNIREPEEFLKIYHAYLVNGELSYPYYIHQNTIDVRTGACTKHV